ncbi:hypothetical protein ACFQHW_00930 [Lapidilactobacillus achengensis]|uniref:Uncharacterized protein n=1 Tax=Lapidilactobacillus achengensis TaxID=2486000 RepID=A0ABW1UKE8_9LACO|nr:hypothetical protein [Lapidilactobacillus achengensis]
MRGFPSIDHSLPVGVSAQTTVITLSGWSGEIRGEIAVKLSLAALPLRTRLSFEIRAGFAKLKVTPTASSPRISQRKPRPTYFWGWYGNTNRFGLGDRYTLRRPNNLTHFLNNSWMETNRFG